MAVLAVSANQNPTVFWKEKIARNRKRDMKVNRELRKRGWRVLRIWEHDLQKRGEACVRKIKAALSPDT